MAMMMTVAPCSPRPADWTVSSVFPLWLVAMTNQLRQTRQEGDNLVTITGQPPFVR